MARFELNSEDLAAMAPGHADSEAAEMSAAEIAAAQREARLWLTRH